jgi:two-component system sensor kinase FixL
LRIAARLRRKRPIHASYTILVRALLLIRDSGPGISPDRLEQIFEPFLTAKDQGMGMGMGLCIARTIIEWHGGSLSAEGRPSGAVFHVRLPLVRG